MTPHSSTLPWKIPWTEEPGRLQSMGSLSWLLLASIDLAMSMQSFDSLSCDLKSHLMVGPNISGFLLSARRLSSTASNGVSFSFSA